MRWMDELLGMMLEVGRHGCIQQARKDGAGSLYIHVAYFCRRISELLAHLDI